MHQRCELLKARDDSLCMAVVPVSRAGGASNTPRSPRTRGQRRGHANGSHVIGASTLTTRTSTNTDIIQSSRDVVDFRQFRLNDHCTVIGCPDLPAELVSVQCIYNIT